MDDASEEEVADVEAEVEEEEEEEEEEIAAKAAKPQPSQPLAPSKLGYVLEAACRRYHVPDEAVLFSAYKSVPVSDGLKMGVITSSNSPSVWTNSGVSWKHLVRLGVTIDDVLYEGLYVAMASEADPNASDKRFLRRLTSAPSKHFVTELAGLGPKASAKYANLIAFNLDSPRLDPVAARFRQLTKEQNDGLTVAFKSKQKATPAKAKASAAPAAAVAEPSDEDSSATQVNDANRANRANQADQDATQTNQTNQTNQNGKRPAGTHNIRLDIDNHVILPRDYFEQLVKDSWSLKRLKARAE